MTVSADGQREIAIEFFMTMFDPIPESDEEF